MLKVLPLTGIDVKFVNCYHVMLNKYSHGLYK